MLHDTATTAFVSLDPEAVAAFAARWRTPVRTGSTGGWPLYAFSACARPRSVDDPDGLPAPEADWLVELSRLLAEGEAVVVAQRSVDGAGTTVAWSCHALTADGLVHTESGTTAASGPRALAAAEARTTLAAERAGLVTPAELAQRRPVLA